MCSSYWTLKAVVECPKCHKTQPMEMQTHFMGEPGSCLNTYEMYQLIPELQGVSVELDGRIDDFITTCPLPCYYTFLVGAVIEKGAVVKVWPIEEESHAG